jgi:hypothetical protein
MYQSLFVLFWLLASVSSTCAWCQPLRLQKTAALPPRHMVLQESSAVNEMILNDSLPHDFRAALLTTTTMLKDAQQANLLKDAQQANLLKDAQQANLLKDAQQANLLKDAQQANLLKDAQQANLLKDAQHATECALHAARETDLNAKLKEAELLNLLEIAMEKNYAINPRSVIEYVEQYVMAKQDEMYAKNKNRQEVWEMFLQDKNGPGVDILGCLKKDLQDWNTAAKASKNISNLYSVASQGIHSTSHEIAEDKSKLLEIKQGSWLIPQGARALICIGKVLGLRTEIKM